MLDKELVIKIIESTGRFKLIYDDKVYNILTFSDNDDNVEDSFARENEVFQLTFDPRTFSFKYLMELIVSYYADDYYLRGYNDSKKEVKSILNTK